MLHGRQAGFTIIEMSLFLAISGLLLLIAVSGTGNTIATNRFNDSVRSAQGYLQGQYSDILNGVNARDGNQACNSSTGQVGSGSEPAGTSNCLLMGKLIQFTKGSADFRSYYVVGSIPALPPAPGLSDDQLITLYKPHMVPSVANDTYQIPWGTNVFGTCRSPAQATAVCKAPPVKFDSYLLIRSPASGNILGYIFYVGGTPASNNLTPYAIAANHVSANICLQSADNSSRYGMVNIASNGGQAGISTNFDSAIDVSPASMCSGV